MEKSYGSGNVGKLNVEKRAKCRVNKKKEKLLESFEFALSEMREQKLVIHHKALNLESYVFKFFTYRDVLENHFASHSIILSPFKFIIKFI